MKTHRAWILYMGLGVSCLAVEQQVEPTVTDRGPHHRTIETIKRDTLRDGTVLGQPSRQVELATGMHYWDNGAWAESKELIEPHPNGAVAQYGQHKAAFAANFNTRGAIQVVDADGNRFTSHILGLAFTDTASGQSIMIGETKDSLGQILPPNQIVYSDAFTGIKADVRYTYTRQGFEQDIILREALPVTPADYQMDPATARLEVFTEFLEAPGGVVTDEILRLETDLVKRQNMVLPDFVDQDLKFGPMSIGKGKAIDFEGVVTNEIPVAKSWEIREGRTFLIEVVEFPSVQPAIEALPKKEAKLRVPGRSGAVRQAANKTVVRPFPTAPKRQAAADRKPMGRVASLNLRPGVLLDYALTISGGLTNFIFRPEVTHSVGTNSTVNLYGTNTIVGGTIVKYAPGGVLSFNGNIVCDTTPYHPAVFTASTDNTMGDTVTAGSPSGYYAAIAMYAASTVTGELHDLRFSYAAKGIDWAGSQERFYNLQFINCSNAVRRYHATNAPFHNVLATNIVYLFTGSESIFKAQQVTAHNVSFFANVSGTPGKVTLTNSILLNVTNLGFGSVENDYIATNGTTWAGASHRWPVSLSDFQVSVGGYHYLATNSALHDVGTANIDASLLSEIRSLTTYAPTLLTSTAQVNVTFSPIALRDNDTPDLGYHYTPLDYIVRGYKLNTNVVLIMTNGVAVGIDYSNQSWGLIFDSATNLSIGSPTNLS